MSGAGLMQSFERVPLKQVQKYWDERPCNIRHSTKPVGTREYFDEVEARKYRVEPHIPGFAEFKRWKGKDVLEIGCGIGTDTINFARAGARVTAVELSEESFKMAKQRAEVFGLTDKIRFYRGNAETLSKVVPPKAYDLVYSFGVIHHTPHPERVLEEIREHYVKPGTVVKIMVYYRFSWKVFWILMTYGRGRFWKANELVARHSEAQTGCPVTYTYSRRDFRRLLGAGLRPAELRVDHIFPYRIPDYVQYRYVKMWYFRALPKPVFRWLERHFGWHLCATAVAGVPSSPA